MLEAGQKAPDFELPDADMEMSRLSHFRGKNVVLYFYPKDDTPGCTIEAIDFSELEEEFVKQNTVVVGISRDDCMSHGSFRDKHGLTIRLLADTEGEVCNHYGVLQEKEVEGKKKTGIVRSTFIIDGHGTVCQAMYGVNARGHAEEVLNAIKKINLQKSRSTA